MTLGSKVYQMIDDDDATSIDSLEEGEVSEETESVTSADFVAFEEPPESRKQSRSPVKQNHDYRWAPYSKSRCGIRGFAPSISFFKSTTKEVATNRQDNTSPQHDLMCRTISQCAQECPHAHRVEQVADARGRARHREESYNPSMGSCYRAAMTDHGRRGRGRYRY